MNEINEEAIYKFKNRLRSKNIQESTLKVYERHLRDLFNLDETKTWDKIVLDDIDKFWEWKLKQNELRAKTHLGRGIGRLIESEKYSPSTLNNIYTAFRKFFSIMGRDKFAKSITLAKQLKWLPPRVSLDKIPKLLNKSAVIEGYKLNHRAPSQFVIERDNLLINFLFATGARISECHKLKKEHLNLTAKLPTVILYGKNDKEREVPLSKRWIELFKKHSKKIKGDYVFSSEGGRQLSVGTLKTLFRQAAKAIKIPEFRSPHRLRHAYATYLVELGVNPKDIQDLLGHEDLGTTGRYLDRVKGKYVKSPLDDLFEKE